MLRKTAPEPSIKGCLVLLAENSFWEPGTFRLDHLRVEDGIRRARVVPRFELVVLSLAPAKEVVELTLALRRRDQERPSLLVDQALGKVALPDGRLEPRRLIHDQPIKALSKQ